MSILVIMQPSCGYTGQRACAAFILLFSLGFLSGTPLQAQDSPASPAEVELEPRLNALLNIDWSGGTAELILRHRLGDRERLTPSLRADVLQRMERLLPMALLETLSPLPINSSTTFSSRYKENPRFTAHVSSVARSARQVRTHFSREMSSFIAVYGIRLYPDLIDPLIEHDSVHLPPPLLEYVPTGNYSGIVIYVKEEMPLFNSDQTGRFSPSLFPRVLDPGLEPVIEKTMIEPSALRSRGMAAFVDYAEMDSLPARVGDVPFYTSAEALFGRNRTDLIVSRRAARRLRASEHMYELIRRGRIAVVCKLSTR
jgi:hypothetical protein